MEEKEIVKKVAKKIVAEIYEPYHNRHFTRECLLAAQNDKELYNSIVEQVITKSSNFYHYFFNRYDEKELKLINEKNLNTLITHICHKEKEPVSYLQALLQNSIVSKKNYEHLAKIAVQCNPIFAGRILNAGFFKNAPSYIYKYTFMATMKNFRNSPDLTANEKVNAIFRKFLYNENISKIKNSKIEIAKTAIKLKTVLIYEDIQKMKLPTDLLNAFIDSIVESNSKDYYPSYPGFSDYKFDEGFTPSLDKDGNIIKACKRDDVQRENLDKLVKCACEGYNPQALEYIIFSPKTNEEHKRLAIKAYIRIHPCDAEAAEYNLARLEDLARELEDEHLFLNMMKELCNAKLYSKVADFIGTEKETDGFIEIVARPIAENGNSYACERLIRKDISIELFKKCIEAFKKDLKYQNEMPSGLLYNFEDQEKQKLIEKARQEVREILDTRKRERAEREKNVVKLSPIERLERLLGE